MQPWTNCLLSLILGSLTIRMGLNEKHRVSSLPPQHATGGAGVRFSRPPSPIPEIQLGCFFATRVQSCGPGSTNQKRPCEKEIRSGTFAVADARELCELLKNTVMRLLVLPEAQQLLSLKCPDPALSGQTAWLWCVAKAATIVWLPSVPVA